MSRTIVVTGASAGVGRATAAAFAAGDQRHAIAARAEGGGGRAADSGRGPGDDDCAAHPRVLPDQRFTGDMSP